MRCVCVREGGVWVERVGLCVWKGWGCACGKGGVVRVERVYVSIAGPTDLLLVQRVYCWSNESITGLTSLFSLLIDSPVHHVAHCYRSTYLIGRLRWLEPNGYICEWSQRIHIYISGRH
jgi:hypothetical protein